MILFIDELHQLIGAGAVEGSMDAANILKPALARGELQCIGATTLDEYKKHIEKDTALARRFQPVLVGEPTEEDAIQILFGLRDRYEAFHKARITDETVRSAVTLSARYISDRYLPDKAIDLIDEACSDMNLHDPDINRRMEVKRDLENVTFERENLMSAQPAEGQEFTQEELDARYARIAELRSQELRLQQELSDLEAKGMPQLTMDNIARVIEMWTKIPASKIKEEEFKRLSQLEDRLKQHIVGQDEAVSAVSAAIRRSRVGLKDPKRPIGSFLFLGPTGVGKTELAKALAECLFDDERALVRIDMSEYMEKFSVQRLIGAPPGYVGYDEGGQLTEAVRRRPYSVILLDEMEKAHPDVFNVLLQVLDDGRLTDGQGRQVSFKNTIIIMTSNVGSKAIADLSGKDEEEMRHQVDAAMAQTFRPEFLNRIDDIVVFHPLGMAQIEKIVDIQLADVRARLAKERMTLAITPAAKQMLAVGGLDPVFGARPLKRLVQREVVDAIAAAIIDGTVREGDQVTVDADKDGGFTVVCDNTPTATYEVPDAE
mgnify:CR=1 FL=1